MFEKKGVYLQKDIKTNILNMTNLNSQDNISTHGKAIYKPEGKAGEYSAWACNLYNGCPNMCAYCYNNHNIMAKKLGGNVVRLKATLIDEKNAFSIFCAELDKYKSYIIQDGSLHFNFVSDPCLSETIELNWRCIDYALEHNVPCQILTKKADWLDNPVVQNALGHQKLIRIGFSLTGCDNLEPGASPNNERIHAMRVIHDMGISTWASIEPIIDPQASYTMISNTLDCCDHYKIGILSGKKNYTPQEIREFVSAVLKLNPQSVYFKNSLQEFIKKG
jgi:DNA repair photolyase